MALKGMLRRIASLGVSLAYVGWSNIKLRNSDQCVALYFHGVTVSQAPLFRRQMQWLKSAYQIVPLRALLNSAESSSRVCVTFDDSLDNVRENALPILQELGISATVFAVPGNLGQKPSWAIADDHPDRHERISTGEQLQKYPPALIEIGSHTMTHPDLTKLKGDSLANELAQSKKALEELMGYEVVSLSVPFGSYNQETLRAADEIGYKVVVTCDPVPFRPGDSPLCVGRFKVTPNDWSLEFRLKARGAHAWRRAWQALKSGASQHQFRRDQHLADNASVVG